MTADEANTLVARREPWSRETAARDGATDGRESGERSAEPAERRASVGGVGPRVDSGGTYHLGVRWASRRGMPRCAPPGHRRAGALVGLAAGPGASSRDARCSDSRAAETGSDSGEHDQPPFTPTPSAPPTTEAVTEARHAASDLVEQRVAAVVAKDKAAWLATVADPAGGFGGDQARPLRPDDRASHRQARPAHRRHRASGRERRPPATRRGGSRGSARPTRSPGTTRGSATSPCRTAWPGPRRDGGSPASPTVRTTSQPFDLASPGRRQLADDAGHRRPAHGHPARIPRAGRRGARPDRRGLGRGPAGGHRRPELARRAQGAARAWPRRRVRPDRRRHRRAARPRCRRRRATGSTSTPTRSRS